MHPLTQAFHERFFGLERAHGRYYLQGKAVPGEKHEGQGGSYYEPVTDDLWSKHLEGAQGIGIVPINEQGRCRWGVIDIDIYKNFSLEALEQQIKDANLPLVVCRTKSGGAHVFLFLTEDAPAKMVRRRLFQWKRILGHLDVEVFPKQDNQVSDEDVGSWLNMPYFNEADTVRYAICNGDRLSAAAFLEYAEAKAVTPAELEQMEEREDEEWKGAPPCIKYLVQHGVPEGGRNAMLFNIGVYFAKRFPESSEAETLQRLLDINKKIFSNPLPFKEVRSTVARSVKKKNYFYQCKNAPLVNVCDRELCRDAEYGIGNCDLEVDLENLEAYGRDPTIYHVTVNGTRIRLEGSEALYSQKQFHIACMEYVRRMPNQVKQSEWRQAVNDLFAEMIEVHPPEDTSSRAYLWHLIDTFCTSSTVHSLKEDILNGSAYDNGAAMCFQLKALQKFLASEGVRDAQDKGTLLAQFLTSKGATVEDQEISKKPVKVWCVPKDAFSRQPEKNNVRVDDKTEF